MALGLDEALNIALEVSPLDQKKCYGAVDGVPLGVGLFYKGIRFPVFNLEDNLYDTTQGYVYILTHECDLDQDNKRPFNEDVLVCPILPFEDFLSDVVNILSDEAQKSFVDAVAKRSVNKLIYIPPLGDELKSGGVLNLNRIGSSHISCFDENQNENAKVIGCLTDYGLMQMDNALENHLLRPKASLLPMVLN